MGVVRLYIRKLEFFQEHASESGCVSEAIQISRCFHTSKCWHVFTINHVGVSKNIYLNIGVCSRLEIGM